MNNPPPPPSPSPSTSSDYDMQSTISALTSEVGNQMLHSVESDMEDEEEKEGERGGGGGQVGGGNQGVYEIEMDQEESGVAPRLKLGLNRVSNLDKGARSGKMICRRLISRVFCLVCTSSVVYVQKSRISFSNSVNKVLRRDLQNRYHVLYC